MQQTLFDSGYLHCLQVQVSSGFVLLHSEFASRISSNFDCSTLKPVPMAAPVEGQRA